MDKRRIKRDFDDKAALVLENVETKTPKRRQWRKNTVWTKEDRTDYQATKPKDPPISLANHPDKAPRIKDFDRQAVLALENDETKTPKRRQWRKNVVWTTENQTEHHAIKRKDPPNALANPTDNEPRVKRQVQQNDINNQHRQYIPPRGRNWRYNRVWRKDMVWTKQDSTTVSNAGTKSGQVSSTTVSNAGTKSGQESSSKDSTTVSGAGTKSGQVSSTKNFTTVSNAGTKSGQVSSTKNFTTVSDAGTKSGQVSFSKDSRTVSNAGTRPGQVSSSKKIVNAKKETKDSLTTAVVPEKTPKVEARVETVVSPETRGASPVHKENKSLLEETVKDVSCEKNSVLGDCIADSLKRKRGQSQDIPSKKRLLEAIPSRGLQPQSNPRFLWNIEKELELLADLYEDLRL